MTQSTLPSNIKLKRFSRLRRAYWNFIFSARHAARRCRYYIYDARELWRYSSHVAVLFPRYIQNYLALYRIYKSGFQVSPRPKLIIISLTEHMGDLIACAPVARSVRAQNPEAYIVWVVGERYRALVEHNPHINQILTVTCLTQWMLLARLPFIDQVIDLHLEGRYCQVCRIPLKKQCGNLDITIENYYAYGSLQTSFCLGAGLSALKEQPQIYFPRNIASRIKHLKLPEKFIVIHTRSNETSRDWLPERWRALVARLLAEWQGTIVEVGISSGMPWDSELKASTRARNLRGKLSILETAEVIRRAQLFIGVDSGPAHLANALNVPGVILLGSYRAFDQYTPYDGAYADPTRADLIRADGPPASIPVEQVYAAVMARLRA